MSLQEQLNQLRHQVRNQTPADLQQRQDQSIDDLKKAGLVNAALSVGDHAPDFTLTDHLGKRVMLSRLIKDGPVVLNFYRGGWCPYCNLELNALQRALPEFKSLGGQLIAISPESPDNSLSTVEKHKLAFPVLSDRKSGVARTFGIVYQVPEYLKPVFEKFGLDLKTYNDNDTIELPIPATYVIDSHQRIRFAFANEDFTVRADIREIINVLKSLKNPANP